MFFFKAEAKTPLRKYTVMENKSEKTIFPTEYLKTKGMCHPFIYLNRIIELKINFKCNRTCTIFWGLFYYVKGYVTMRERVDKFFFHYHILILELMLVSNRKFQIFW